MGSKKLRPKYLVHRISDTTGELLGVGMKSTDPDNINSPFVLMPRKDPAALIALVSYSKFCEKDLSDEIKEWLKKIFAAEPALGTQGSRNVMTVVERLT